MEDVGGKEQQGSGRVADNLLYAVPCGYVELDLKVCWGFCESLSESRSTIITRHSKKRRLRVHVRLVE